MENAFYRLACYPLEGRDRPRLYAEEAGQFFDGGTKGEEILDNNPSYASQEVLFHSSCDLI